MEKYGVVRPEFGAGGLPSLDEVAKHGEHSPKSWEDIKRMREELAKEGFPLPNLKSHLTDE